MASYDQNNEIKQVNKNIENLFEDLIVHVEKIDGAIKYSNLNNNLQAVKNIFPSNMKIIKGNLIKSEEQYICHQCNCITIGAKYLAKSIFTKYPYADTYRLRKNPKRAKSIPGTIDVCGSDELNNRYVINMYGQIGPGNPNVQFEDESFNNDNDTAEMRKKYFCQCLQLILSIKQMESIAFPCYIGCGAAGGNWRNYFCILKKFALLIPNVKIVIYDLDGLFFKQIHK